MNTAMHEKKIKNTRIRIAVYEGEGAGPSCAELLEVLGRVKGKPDFEIVRMDALAIRGGKLSEVDVLIQPGGSGGKQGVPWNQRGEQRCGNL